MKKKILCGLLAVVCLSSVFFAGVFAGGGLETISAYLNHGIKVAKDGQVQELKDANGNTVVPITYNNSTYLPVRAIGNLLGHAVTWDGQTQCVLLDGSPVPAALIDALVSSQTQSGQIIVPDPSAGQMDLSFLNTIKERVGNGKLIYNKNSIENYTVNGVWQGDGDNACYYYIIAVQTEEWEPANEVSAFENALCETLVSNGYTLVKTDEYGYKHYVKGVNEFVIHNYENRYVGIQCKTNWLSCCAEETL